VAGTYECRNEASGSIKCGEILDWLKTGYLLKMDSAPWSKYNSTFSTRRIMFYKIHLDVNNWRCYRMQGVVRASGCT